MIFNIHPTNQKNLSVENLQIRFLFQSKDPHQPQEALPLRPQLHTHSFAELFGCLAGQIHILDAKGKVHLLMAGDLAIVPSGVEHMMLLKHSPDAKWTDLGISFKKNPHSDAADLFGQFRQLLGGEKIALFQNQLALCRLLEQCHQFAAVEELSSLLSFLAEFIKLPAAGQEPATKNEEKAQNIDRLIKLDDIINMNFSQNFSNEEIAKLLFISKRQLSRIVEKNYGEPLRQIILKRRLQGAAELLKTSDERVEKIASAMGFTNKNTFFREFKKHYHCTPLAWRKRPIEKTLDSTP